MNYWHIQLHPINRLSIAELIAIQYNHERTYTKRRRIYWAYWHCFKRYL